MKESTATIQVRKAKWVNSFLHFHRLLHKFNSPLVEIEVVCVTPGGAGTAIYGPYRYVPL